MKKMTANQIRSSWIEFFKNKNHYFLPPVSLIPINDPSLLWINSGVATLKNYFSGKENPPCNRLVNSQKALRTNDFFNVGVTSRHHTLFEMLGNFSIGDYFKKEAIAFAYELLIKEWQIDPNKLWITIYEDDNEAYHAWIAQGINEHRIIKCDRERNFWDVGNGPCGPCTEIHYDRGEKYDPQHIGEKLILEDIENDRYVEIWNIVFSQYNNDGHNNYQELLRKNIDTGAGLERLACISQDVPTNFDTDLFQIIIHEVEKYSPYKYEINNYFTNDIKQKRVNFAYKVIADHFRAAVLAIADGAIPDNKDRGYILRRLIRRAIVFAHNLAINDASWLEAALLGVINSLQPFYSYLIASQKQIIAVIKKEAELFNATLKQGLKLFNNAINSNNLDDDMVFKLVATYGFPIEIIKEMASEHNLNINEEEFKKRFNEHQKISNANNTTKALENQNNSLMNLVLPSQFHYNQFEITSKIIALYDNNFDEVETLNGDGYFVVSDTVFYATSGGQQHDIGLVNNQYVVDNVIKGPNLQHIHHVLNANLKLGEEISLAIDVVARKKNMAHHSAEHLLQAALQNIVTKDIKQQGAFKSPTKMTFDLQYPEKLSDETLQQVEDWLNNVIHQAIPVEVLMMSLDEAKQNNVIAYFEDKYKKIGVDKLRVIKMGDKSMELCGGTHVHNTKDIGEFAITNFVSKGSGLWRIEALATKDNIQKYKEDFLPSLKTLVDDVANNLANVEYDKNQLHALYEKYFNLVKQAKLRHYPNLVLEFKNALSQFKAEWLEQASKKEVAIIKQAYNAIGDNNKKYVVFDDNYNQANIIKAINELIKENPHVTFCSLLIKDNKLNYIVATNKNNSHPSEYVLDINAISGSKGFDKTNFCIGGGAKANTLKLVQDYLISQGFKNA